MSIFDLWVPIGWERGPDSSTAEWKTLKSSLFGNKEVIISNNVIGIEAPFRAEDAAVVPISITSKIPQGPKRFIKRFIF